MKKSAQVGDVIYMAHPEMAHGTRPMIVMGMDDNQLMLMPISHTPLNGKQQPIKGWKEVGFMAANRVFAIARSMAPAPIARPKWNWKRIANDCWDCFEGYQAAIA